MLQINKKSNLIIKDGNYEEKTILEN